MQRICWPGGRDRAAEPVSRAIWKANNFGALPVAFALVNLKQPNLNLHRTLMTRKATTIALVLIALTTVMMAQNNAPAANGGRKVVVRVEPTYPELAKRMHLQGVVKIEVVVRPNGSVKSTHVLGGNPVLTDAAVEAVTKCKFEAGPDETTEIIQVAFTPR
jgi:TonB family protein